MSLQTESLNKWFEVLELTVFMKSGHIFQKAQVTSNKTEPKRKRNFLAQFVMAFLVVWFILYRLLAFGTIK